MAKRKKLKLSGNENIFLIYANNRFRDNSENLHKVFKKIIPRIHPDSKPSAHRSDSTIHFYESDQPDENTVRYLLDQTTSLLEIDDQKKAEKSKFGAMPWIDDIVFEV